MIVAADAHVIDGHDRLATLAVIRLGVEVSGVTSLPMLTALDRAPPMGLTAHFSAVTVMGPTCAAACVTRRWVRPGLPRPGARR